LTKNIFYSWQSDLPNNLNRGFIESSIQAAIQQLSTVNIHLEIAIDRDTMGVQGTPDITKEIFDKISESHIFIADISFIDENNQKRRFCNPNVLIELGYAAQVIGWENIICVFNSQFGAVEELPFDLRHRRPFQYKITNPDDKTKDRESLRNLFNSAISSIINKQTNRDKIIDYIKLQLDNEILSISNHVKKILYGYDKYVELNEFLKILDLTDKEIKTIFEKNEFLGFQIIKDWEGYIVTLKRIIENPTFTKYIHEDKLAPILELISTLMLIDLSFRQHFFFVNLNKAENRFAIIDGHAMNKSNPENSYILAKDTDVKAEQRVVDFGIISSYNLENALKYFKLKEDARTLVGDLFSKLIKNIDEVLKNWGNTIIINPALFKSY
jgi:hypothetical protein